MIEDLRWVRGPFNDLVLEAYDGHQWFPVPYVDAPLDDVIPGIKKDSSMTPRGYHEQMGYVAAQPDKGAR